MEIHKRLSTSESFVDFLIFSHMREPNPNDGASVIYQGPQKSMHASTQLSDQK